MVACTAEYTNSEHLLFTIQILDKTGFQIPTVVVSLKLMLLLF